MVFKTLYGPVHSGRLGLSLGVDLLGKRICSMDCLYCEVGPTSVHTLKRHPYMPAQVILDELYAWRRQKLPRPKHITLGGLGEPCLNSDLPEIIAGCRDIFPDIPVAVLTNSSLLHDPSVRRELAAVQVVLPSLDSLVEHEFLIINQPCRGVNLALITSGLLQFRREYAGCICLEILLLQGFNDTQENLDLQRQFLAELQPDRVDVVTMTRPGSSLLAKAVEKQTLSTWRAVLEPLVRTTIAPGQLKKYYTAGSISAEMAVELVLNSLRRRPQTPEQLSAALDLDVARTKTIVDVLLREGRITRDFGDDFYRAVL